MMKYPMLRFSFIATVALAINACGPIKDVSEMKSTTNEMNKNTKDMLKEMKNMSQGMNSMQTGMNSMNGTTKGMNGNMVSMHDDMAELVGLMKIMSGQMTEMNGSITGMRGDMKDMSADMKSLLGAMGGMNKHIEGMHSDMSTMLKSIDGMRGEMKEMGTDIKSMGADMKTLITAMGSMNEQITGMHSDMSKMVTSIGTMSTQMTTMNKSIDSMSGDMKNMGGDIKEMLGQMGSMNKEIEGMHSKMSALVGAIGSMSSQMTDMNASIKDMHGDMKSVSTQMTSMNTSIGLMTSLMKDLNGDMGIMVQKITKMNGTLGIAYEDARTALAAAIRSDALDELKKTDDQLAKMGIAAKYMVGHTYQSWEPTIDTVAKRSQLMASAVEEFLKSASQFVGNRDDIQPLYRTSQAKNRYAIAAALDYVNYIQLNKLEGSKYKPVNMYSMLIDGLRAGKLIQEGKVKRKDIPTYQDNVLTVKDDAIYYLQIRHNFLRGVAANIINTEKSGDDFETRIAWNLATAWGFGKKYTAKDMQYKSAAQIEITATCLDLAAKTVADLKSVGITPIYSVPVNKILFKADLSKLNVPGAETEIAHLKKSIESLRAKFAKK